MCQTAGPESREICQLMVVSDLEMKWRIQDE